MDLGFLFLELMIDYSLIFEVVVIFNKTKKKPVFISKLISSDCVCRFLYENSMRTQYFDEQSDKRNKNKEQKLGNKLSGKEDIGSQKKLITLSCNCVD